MSHFDDLERKSHELGVLVEHWFFEAFHGSLVARSTEVWNHVHDAKDELKRRLVSFLATLADD